MTAHPNLLRLSAAAGARKASEDRFRLALIVALDGRDGYTVDQIAEAAGFSSRARVYQIAEEAKANGHG